MCRVWHNARRPRRCAPRSWATTRSACCCPAARSPSRRVLFGISRVLEAQCPGYGRTAARRALGRPHAQRAAAGGEEPIQVGMAGLFAGFLDVCAGQGCAQGGCARAGRFGAMSCSACFSGVTRVQALVRITRSRVSWSSHRFCRVTYFCSVMLSEPAAPAALYRLLCLLFHVLTLLVQTPHAAWDTVANLLVTLLFQALADLLGAACTPNGMRVLTCTPAVPSNCSMM